MQLKKKPHLSTFRKMAIGTWKTEYDPQVYGQMQLRVDSAVAYIKEFRQVTGKRITMSHLVARACAATLERMPDANAILRFNRIYLRQEINIFFQVALKDPDTGETDLSGATIRNADQKNLEELVDDFATQVAKTRNRKDKNLEKSRNMFKKMPYFLLSPVLWLVGFLSYGLNLNLRWAGIPKDPFGSMMITNIGSLGLSEAYVPLVPYSRVPLILAMGAVRDEPIVVKGQLAIGKIMRVCCTFDHRVLDGAHLAVMCKTLESWMQDPYNEAHFGPIQSEQDAMG